jgi:hypothetical protein
MVLGFTAPTILVVHYEFGYHRAHYARG